MNANVDGRTGELTLLRLQDASMQHPKSAEVYDLKVEEVKLIILGLPVDANAVPRDQKAAEASQVEITKALGMPLNLYGEKRRDTGIGFVKVQGGLLDKTVLDLIRSAESVIPRADYHNPRKKFWEVIDVADRGVYEHADDLADTLTGRVVDVVTWRNPHLIDGKIIWKDSLRIYVQHEYVSPQDPAFQKLAFKDRNWYTTT